MNRKIWEHDDVHKALLSFPPASGNAYKDFVNNLSQGYYPLFGDAVAERPTDFSYILPTGERVIYRMSHSEVFVKRLETSTFALKLLNIRARFISNLDNISRVMTFQQIFSILASLMGIKLF